MTKNERLLLIGVVVVGGVLAVRSVKNKAGAVIAAINPTNPDNVVNSAFDSMYQSVFVWGDENPEARTLGGDIAQAVIDVKATATSVSEWFSDLLTPKASPVVTEKKDSNPIPELLRAPTGNVKLPMDGQDDLRRLYPWLYQ